MSNPAILALVAAFFGGALAFAVAMQARRSFSHWSFAAGMAALSIESVFSCFALDANSSHFYGAWIQWETAKLITQAFLPGLWLAFSLSYARGNSQEFLKRWRVAIGSAFVIPIGIAVIFNSDLFAPHRVEAGTQVALGLTAQGFLLQLLFLVSTVVVLMNLERTFRASVGTMRWRIKFMVAGLGLLFLTRAYTSSQALLFSREVNTSLDALDSAALFIACLLIVRSLLRSGHFEVNVYPSHSVIEKSVILLIVGTYLVLLGLFANLVKWHGADTSFTFKAFILLVGIVALTVLLLSERARLHTKRFVSRHFQRPLYDYRTVWMRFTECTAARMDQTEFCRATVRLVAEIFQALSVTIWLLDEQKSNLVFATSTALMDAKGASLAPKSADATELIRALERHPEPFDLDASKEKWAVTLRRCNPDEFNKGGNRICVPMTVGGELLGVLVVGDRVSGIPFMHQDMDLLKCIGDQAGASLRNLQLSGKLLQVKEMEAFQTMSAFFVHDLKNTASTLGLMLKNLPIHFNDPAFREDALRGVSKTVTHINNLISRLSLLRHGLEINRTETDLNDVVAKALTVNEAALTMEVVKDFKALPRLALDPEQLHKVITNLVLNASEAVPKPQGQIRIQTSQLNGWAVLTVADNGCGMSPEFLNRSLFRPFQTTKKAGLGIGMFQSKMIVEAHGGRVEVESEPGKGTTFRILLPINKKQ